MNSDRIVARWISGAWLAACLALSGCTLNGAATEPTQRIPSAADGTAGMPVHRADAGSSENKPAPSFADVYATIAMSCGGGKSGCHVSGSSAGLEMPDARTAYDHLVNIASTKCAGEMRVVPGDAGSSVLIEALEGKASCVKPMPLGRDALSADTIAMMRAWIDAGAAYE
jgi:hypothetical protein